MTGEEIGEISYFFANSMEGAFDRFYKSPDSYINTVDVMLTEGENLTIGLVKNVLISNDWTIFDNFKLFYLGTETPTAVSSVNAAASEVKEVYNAAGVRTNGMRSGVNIVKMSDGSVKKVVK